MTFNLDDTNIGGQLKVGTGIFPAIGEGVSRINGSAGIRRSCCHWETNKFCNSLCKYCTTYLIDDSPRSPIIPGGLCSGVNNPYSLAVVGPSAVFMT